VGDQIANIRSDQWTLPTPCTEWNVRDVVNHLVIGNLSFVARVNDGQMPDRGADHLGTDPVEAYRTSAASLDSAFARPGVLERSSAGPLGQATGAELLNIRIYDLIAHSWDLMQATGIRADIPEQLAEQVLAFVRNQLATVPRTARFAEPQPVADDAPAIARLAAFLGRSVPQQ
jgi:uncharacterized protein (TIGR03086 family)